MKKIIKKSKYLLVTGLVFVLSIIVGGKWFNSSLEKAMADAPACLAPNTLFSNGCFTPAQQFDWIARNGDGNGGGDTGGGAGGS